ncbi:MAG TPA: MlaD family protein, partial [Thermoleophilaceae bacterium]
MQRAFPLLLACLALAAAGCGDNGHHYDPGARLGYQVEARYASAPAGLRTGSPVRIAGVDVGRVTAVRRGGGGPALVELTIDFAGQPVYTNADATLRPRIFQAGAYFVDLRPGTPRSGLVPDGGRIRGRVPVTS